MYLQDFWNSELAPRPILTARPSTSAPTAAPSGLHPIPLASGREGLLYVPPTYDAQPGPFIVMLHGAGSSAQRGLDHVRTLADVYRAIILAPQSLDRTWDLLIDGYGPDVAAIDHALGEIFERYVIDPERVALAGFSDGASYALSLGTANGDLFKHIIAFSPGFAVPSGRAGDPRIFISHGTQDTVLPIALTSRMLAPMLQIAGYTVDYMEFDGEHRVPEHVLRAAYEWLATSNDADADTR
jgi:phospholipase/carboxylesterase